MSDACEMADFVEPPPMNNNKEAEEKQTSKSKKKKKASAQDSTNSEDVVEITKRKEVESEVKKSSPHPLVTTSSEDSVQNSNKSSKRKKENISLDALIITTEKPTKVVVSAPVQQQRNGPELDTLKKSKQPADVTEIAVTHLRDQSQTACQEGRRMERSFTPRAGHQSREFQFEFGLWLRSEEKPIKRPIVGHFVRHPEL